MADLTATATGSAVAPMTAVLAPPGLYGLTNASSQATREILAGTAGWHGKHEHPRDGWDRTNRVRHGDHPDALTRGRHAADAR